MPILECHACNGEMFFANDAETICKHCGISIITKDGKFVLAQGAVEAHRENTREKLKAAKASGDLSNLNSKEIEALTRSIVISTGDVHQNYKVIDAIFAFDSHEQGFIFGQADPGKAFDGVKDQLRKKCLAQGGDAVICCQFEYRVAAADGLPGKERQVFEILAYGTAIKYLKQARPA